MMYSGVDSKRIPLETKLNEIFKNKRNGFYIELGANDGLFQSNTAFFEKNMGWTGILIEPSIKGFEQCIINRPKSICLNYACVSDDYDKEFIFGDFFDNHPMGSVSGNRLKRVDLMKVKATTLEKILDDHNVSNIDFLSLDTEGYELNILKGMNLDKYRPKYMLIEVYPDEYNDLLDFLESKLYVLHSNFTNYNKIDNPGWDGTHNDYLFIDSLQ